jgi:hypothetical protein
MQNNRQAKRLRDIEGTIKSDRMIIYYGLVYVPKKVRKEIMEQAYDIIISGYFEIEKIMERIKQSKPISNIRIATTNITTATAVGLNRNGLYRETIQVQGSSNWN